MPTLNKKPRKPTQRQEFSGEILVASRIVDYLSSGLYESPAACLKELINNSYDADACSVKVFVQPDADRIIISDDGHGMNRRDFEHNFKRISESFKRSGAEYTEKRNRPKIGKIGIGFIAANEICDIMEIHSTKQGSAELINVTIDFAKMRQGLGQRRRSKSDFAKGDYYGKVLQTDKESHYTQIFLRRVRGEARQILVGAHSPTGHDGHRYSLYGKDERQISHDLLTLPISSWSDFDPYSETMLRVALNVPIKYHQNWVPSRLKNQVQYLEREVAKLDFNVYYDGTDLRKPVVLRDEQGDAIVKSFQYDGKSVSATGYFYVHHGSLKPQELNGLIVRIRNAAIGGYDPSFMGFPSSRGQLFQKWISAEVWASDELEEAMNIDRKTLRLAHPAYVELQKAVHDELEKVLSIARSKIYLSGNQKRRERKTEESINQLMEVIENNVPAVSARVAMRIKTAWSPVEDSSRLSGNRILKKFSVAELYGIVIDVASETLSSSQLSRFLAALTERLSKG